VSQSDLIIQFENLSEKSFSLDSNGKDLQKGGNSVITWPGAGTVLQAYSGSVSCEITENLHNVDVGPCTFWCCWTDGQNRFGVQIHANTQVLNMGSRPEWFVMSDHTPGGAVTWNSNGGDPSDSYTWPTSVGYNIVATPSSTHQSLTVKVVINNAKK
jgi:hypothetical protein